MRPGQFLASEGVELGADPLGEPPTVGENDRRSVSADQIEDPRVDRLHTDGLLVGSLGSGGSTVPSWRTLT